MHEQILRNFFLAQASSPELRHDLKGAIVRTGQDTYNHPIVAMTDEFQLSAEHLVRLCDAVLAAELDPADLEPIGFCLIASDRFTWEEDASGEIIGETLHRWASPQINYPLNAATVAKFRHHLLTGEDTFKRTDFRGASA